jgi:multiple sugar transport system permease protein
MENEAQKHNRAGRMLDDLMAEGLESSGSSGHAQPQGPILPRMRMVMVPQAAPVSVTRKKSPAPGQELKPVSQLLPEILKEVDEAKRQASRAVFEKARQAAIEAAAAPTPALPETPAQAEGRQGKGISRIRRRYALIFNKDSSQVFRPRRAAVVHDAFEDKAIYRSRGEEKPLRVSESWWESPKLTTFAFLAPPLIAFLLFSWLPMARGFLLSLQKVSLIGQSSFVGFDNYARAFNDPQFWATLGHAALFCGLSLVCGFWLPIALAIYLNELKRGQGLLRFAFFLPFLTPTVPAVILWRWIFDQGYGLVNSVLAGLGFSDPHVPWLNQPLLAMLSVVLVFLWKNTGWNSLIYLTGLREVSEELYEAAELDGAPVWRRIFHISLPSLRSTMGVLFLMQVINSFQIFTEVYLLTSGGPMASTEVIATYMYKKSFLYLDIGYASALAVILFLALISLTQARLRSMERED